MATTVLDPSSSVAAPRIAAGAPSLSNSTFVRLLRFALANVRRRPERFALATFGIALAILSVTVVRTISSSFAITGDETVTRVLDGAPLWVVPAEGVHYDSDVGAIVADGPPPDLAVPDGWTAKRTLTDSAGDGWWTVTPPAADADRNDLGALLANSTGLPSTTNPAVQPDGGPLIYDAVGGSGAVTFEQKFSALFSGTVTSSTLGLISTIGLVLGFVIAVSSFLASVQERRREFGIMASIGLADEVLYFFLVESALVFVAAYAIGIGLAAAAVWLVIPQIATPVAWLQAAGTVAAYLPAMAIVGALVPVHRLLQQRPVQLLGDAA
jgi:ABC-type antimicrobial peptide transport system permease subunit